MKSCFHTIFIIFFSITAFSQQCASTLVYPNPPQVNNPLDIVVAVFFSNGAPGSCFFFEGYTATEVQNVLTIEMFYDVSGAWPAMGCTRMDTAHVEKVNINIEKIIVRTYATWQYDPNPADTMFVDSDTLFFNTAGIRNLSKNQINIYPNPTSNKLYLDIPGHYGVEGIELFSLKGSLVRSFDDKARLLDVSAMAKGLYFLAIRTKEDFFVRKIVVVDR